MCSAHAGTAVVDEPEVLHMEVLKRRDDSESVKVLSATLQLSGSAGNSIPFTAVALA